MILELRDVCKDYTRGKNLVPVLKNVNLQVEQGDYIAIMGPSGSGKTTLMNLVGCLDLPTSGQYILKDQDMSTLNDNQLAEIRNQHIGFVFQNFYLLPKMTALDNVALPLLYAGVSQKERRERAKAALESVGLAERLHFYPNQLSGGQCQRVAIAIALILDPDFVVCDEPVSALDVSVQAQVLNLLLDLREQFGLTYLFISHDLNVVSYVSDRIGVMYLGNLVELGKGEAISQMPLHPYTEALFSASMEVEGDRERIILSGDLPSPAHPPAGCPFHTRCFACTDRCKTEKPLLREFEGGRFCACHRVEERTGLKPVSQNTTSKEGTAE